MEYLLNVYVCGVAGLKFPDEKRKAEPPSPFVEVTVFEETKTTRTETGFAAEFDCSYSIQAFKSHDDFMDGDAKVSVIHSGWFGREVLGCVVFGLAVVYDQPGHVVRKNWFPLTLPDSPHIVRGFAQLSLGVYAPGDSVPRQAQGRLNEDTDEIPTLKSRLVTLPDLGDSKNLFQLSVRIYKAEYLTMVSTLMGQNCDPFVEVGFNGTSQQTVTKDDQTSPTWNQEVQVPFQMPSWDDSIDVMVMTGSTKLGDVNLSATELIKQALPPTWFNFYHSPVIGGTLGIGGTKQAECEFGGRLLIAATIARTEAPSLRVGEISRMENTPTVTNNVLWIDLYEVCIKQPEGILECWVTAFMKPLIDDIVSEKPVEGGTGVYVWNNETGRMPEHRFQMPAPEQCSDLFLNVWIVRAGDVWGSTTSKHLYCRIPAEEIFEGDPLPKWLEMERVDSGQFASTGGFLLCSAHIGSDISSRPPRHEVKLRKYLFRAMIHQAVNLPASDHVGSSDTFAVVFFGSACLSTNVYQGSLCPSWYQILEAEVTLPEEEGMRPDVVIFILDMDEDDTDALAMLRYSTRDIDALPKKWKGDPKWFELDEAPEGPITQGKLSAAFELMPIDHVHPRESIRPETVECRVEIFMIGVRLLDSTELAEARIEVAWSRKEPSTAPMWFTPAKVRTVGPGVGSAGQYNFYHLDKLVLSPCRLAQDTTFQDWLEVKLLCEDPDQTDTLKCHCFALIHLTPHLPFLDKEKSAKAAANFRCRSRSEIQQMEVLQKLGLWEVEEIEDSDDDEDDEIDVLEPEKSMAAKAVRLNKAEVEKEIAVAQHLGWKYKSIEESNVRTSQYTEYACITDMQLKQYSQAASRRKSQDQAVKSEALAQEAAGKVINEFSAKFQWPKFVDGEEDYGAHPEIDEELERTNELPQEKLPYHTVALFVGDEDTKEQQIIGSLKFQIRIVEKARYKADEPAMKKENVVFNEMVDRIRQEFDQAKDIEVRVYALGADGLMPCSGSSDCSTYVWTRLAGEEDKLHNLRDTGTTRHHSLNPEFNVVHPFQRCSFPRDTYLRMSIVELVPSLLGEPTHEVVGTTTIDLEDRWFHPTYRNMVDDGTTCIEARRLFRGSSTFGRGHLRLWVDMLEASQVAVNKTHVLPSTQPQEYELRVVIWKVTDITTADGSVPHVQVVGKICLDDGDIEELPTDTHNNASDGTATFNYRLVFKKLLIPCRKASLYLSMISVGYTSNETLALVALDLTRDYMLCKRNGAGSEDVIIPRGKLRLTHVSAPQEVRGVLEMQASVLHGIDAHARPQGQAQEEPNNDPFLDENDPHRLQGRRVHIPGGEAIMAVAGGLAKGLGALLAGALLYKIIGAVIAAIVSLGGIIAVTQAR